MEFLGHRRAADHLAALEHLHAQAGHREIGRADQAVVAGADDDDVGILTFRFKRMIPSVYQITQDKSEYLRTFLIMPGIVSVIADNPLYRSAVCWLAFRLRCGPAPE